MEKVRYLTYVDVGYVYKLGDSVLIREPDWFPKLRPRFQKVFREVTK